MTKAPLALIAALLCAAVPARSRTLEALSADAAAFSVPDLPKLSLTGVADAAAAARIPGYGELIHTLPSEPAMVTKEKVKIWRLAPFTGYDTFRDAEIVMNYWKGLLADSGLTITTYSVTSLFAGRYDYQISYSGEKYLEVFEGEKTFADPAAAEAARAEAESALRANGLAVVKGFVVRGGGEFMLMIYYHAVYAPIANDRLLARRHSPLTLHPTADAARAQAEREKAVLTGLGITVLETSVTSGPQGALHQLQYVGRWDSIREHVSQTYKDKAAAQAALETFVGALAQAAVLDSEVYPAGPWFEDGHAFRVRYAQRRSAGSLSTGR